ncbi:hypothetical protein ACFXAO_15350 [Streptomyces lavendulae]|uniref:hypothetical protein n=1 Tax=Streptomyces lavendulae TaxID=1914 RepID=UPI0036B85E72
MDTRHNRPGGLPPQVRAVRRDDAGAEADARRQGVAAAAGSGCGKLTGMARQMCYAGRHGLRV